MTGPERFWAKVARSTEEACWPWLGSCNKRRRGYGQVRFEGRVRPAHVVAYELSVGPVPPGAQLDHPCRKPACVNPAHLEPVTPRENNARSNSRSALASRATHCPAGHEYAGEHLYRRPDGRRECRTCSTTRQRERRAG